MNNKLSDKDKKDWEKFINSKDKLENKDKVNLVKSSDKITKTIDLHGFTLNKANNEITNFINDCYDKGVTKINIITGKGLRSKNQNNPYYSSDLGILKYSIPEFIKNNSELKKKILKINFDAVRSSSQGSFDIILKKKK